MFVNHCFLFQKALKSQNISLDEVEKDVLGTPEENQPPPKD